MMEVWSPLLWLITGIAVQHHFWPVAVSAGMFSLLVMARMIVDAIDRVREAIEKGSK